MCCLFLVCVAFQSVMLDHDLKCFRGMNLKTLIWSVQPSLNGDGSPFWPCPLRRAHTTCTLVVDLGSPSLFLLCVALRLYLITIFEVSIGTNSSTAITDKSVTLIPSSIHHCNFHLVNTTFCLLFNDLFAISPMVMFSLSFLAVRIEKCQQIFFAISL